MLAEINTRFVCHYWIKKLKNNMSLELKTSIKIHSNAEQIWKVLTNFSEYNDWNPFILSVDGQVNEGNRIKVDLGNMTFKPEVLVYEKNKEFRWLGHLIFKGLFDGEHYFKIIENEDDTCTFVHGEKFKGFLIPMLKKKLLTETKMGFESMNKALKKRVMLSTQNY